MSTSPNEFARPVAVDVEVSEDTLTVHLSDGRSIAAPVIWYPRLADGTAQERALWELVGSGHGIHWPALDEDISVEALLVGQRSTEAASSLKKWLSTRHRSV
jgi:hypothetical protein